MAEPQEVNDRQAENGIKINNILTALVLAGILGMWNSIESLKESQHAGDRERAVSKVLINTNTNNIVKLQNEVEVLQRNERARGK